MINVGWNDAKAYVAWLSRETGLEYRLLSEAEWEYAARAGTTTKYHWGNGFDNGRANGMRQVGKTVPVGGFSPNAFGLYDMHGNVWEWVEDCWHYPDGAVLIEGTFHGDDDDRNYPLMSARLFATDAVDPLFLTYSDGMSFTYSKELDAVINIE